jgi:hypothetical protein
MTNLIVTLSYFYQVAWNHNKTKPLFLLEYVKTKWHSFNVALYCSMILSVWWAVKT